MSLLDCRTDVFSGESRRPFLQSRTVTAVETKRSPSFAKEVLHIIQAALHAVQEETSPLRRAGEEHFLYPQDVYLTPIDPLGHIQSEETLCVLGKQVSQRGLEFVHRELLPYRHMIASLRSLETRWVGLLLELTWCRFVCRDRYENGGRFLGVVESPLQQHTLQDLSLPDARAPFT